MSLRGNFKRVVDVAISRVATGREVRQFLSDEANANVAALVRGNQADPTWRYFVNGIEDAPGYTVRLDRDGSGSIAYLFSRMTEAMPYALEYAKARSPRGATEVYINSWYFIVDGAPWVNMDYRSVPPGAEVILTNSASYHRKIDVGGMRISVAPQIVEQTRQAVMRRFAGIACERRFITIPNGYVLKGRGRRSGISFNKRTKRFEQVSPSLPTNEMDRQKGQPMTYPSLVMKELV